MILKAILILSDQGTELLKVGNWSYTTLPLDIIRTSGVFHNGKKGKKSPGSAQSQATALPRHQEEEETDKTKQAQIEQTYEKH